jgi:endonuclease/exonuclease/phosphatase family metal-dependent hydrolase
MSGFQASNQAKEDDDEPLSLLQINVWSGSKYDILWSSRTFDSFETPEYHNQRFEALIKGIRTIDPDVISLNEAMGRGGCKKYLEKLGLALEDYAVFGSIGVSGVILGPISIPSWRTTEGDAILVKRKYKRTFIGRKRLSGQVFNNHFALNLDDATQVLGIKVEKGNTSYAIYCTHWHAGLLDDSETNLDLNELEGFTKKEMKAGMEAIARSTETRVNEAKLTLDFVTATSGEADVIVLMGDLNTTPGTPELKQVEEGGEQRGHNGMVVVAERQAGKFAQLGLVV